jgi:hypothetical protein
VLAGAGLLVEALRRPETVTALGVPQWDALLRQARAAGVLGRLGVRLDELGVLGQLPEKVREQFESSRAIAHEHERVLRWEVNRIQRALAGTAAPLVILKGAAYAVAGLPLARGRLSADVDVMVPRDALPAVEAALTRHGWEAMNLDEYDQRYYRTWGHELPPLRHRDRKTVVDVHHAILPLTSRLRPSSEALLGATRPLAGTAVRVLAPVDMVLHATVHMFHDGDFQSGVRELADLDGLMRHYGAEAGFWDELQGRARQLGLERPLFYALRYTARFFGTPVPPAVRGTAMGRPSPAIRNLMDLLVARAMSPRGAATDRTTGLALWLLYVRSHWLRMPPLLLARHLLRKALRRRADPR